jgi:hypothetical protein
MSRVIEKAVQSGRSERSTSRSSSFPLWTALVRFSGFLLFSGVIFALGLLTGRWTVPVDVGDHARLEPGETWSLHVNRIVSTSQGVRDQEYYAIVNALQQYKDRHLEYIHLVDDQLRLLYEDHEARAKAQRELHHPEWKIE